jgi:hypothetical protein
MSEVNQKARIEYLQGLVAEYRARAEKAEGLLGVAQTANPFAWAIPEPDNANADGWLDCRVSQDGEFSKPLYEHPPTIAQTAKTLVDWTYLYTTQGEAWPDTTTIVEPLIKLAERIPTQADAELLKSGASLKALLALTSTNRPPLNKKSRCPACNLLNACSEPGCPNAMTSTNDRGAA